MHKTFEVLKATRNQAALEVLRSGLDSPDSDIQQAAICALLDRRGTNAHREIVERWDTLSAACRELVAGRSARLEGALRSAILRADPVMHRNACDAVVSFNMYDLLPTLVTAAEDKGNAHPELAGKAAIELCAQLSEELSGPRDYRNRRDPVLVRQYVFGALAQAVQRFEQHGRLELVEAFLILAQPDEPILKRCLHSSHDRIHSAIIHLFSASTRAGVLRLILAFLDDPQPPVGVYSVLCHRRDLAFLRPLFRQFSAAITPAAKSNLRKIDSLAFLRDEAQLWSILDDDEQRGLVQLVLASGLNRLRVFELLKHVMTSGRNPSRRVACAGLAEFKGGEANHLLLASLDDADPEVQALAVSQIRERGIPGILQRLVELVESPHEVVRNAVRGALTEFNFQRYLGAFEMLEPEVRRSTGALVKRVDPLATDHLITELVSLSRARRLRGIEAAAAMGAVGDVETYIVQLASDDDHFIRAEVARALYHIDTDTARQTVHELLLDRSVSVQQAAAQTIERWGAGTSTSAVPVPRLDSPPTSFGIQEATP